MKLFELGTAILVAGLLLSMHFFAKTYMPEYRDAYMKMRDKAKHHHQVFVEPHRDVEPGPAWSMEAFEAK